MKSVVQRNLLLPLIFVVSGCVEQSAQRASSEVPLVIPLMPKSQSQRAAREMESPRPPPIEQDPVAAKAALEKGRDAYAVGDYVKAREHLAQSVQLDSTDGAALYLAMAEEKLGDSNEAAAHYQVAYDLAVAAGNPRAWFAKQRLQALKPQASP